MVVIDDRGAVCEWIGKDKESTRDELVIASLNHIGSCATRQPKLARRTYHIAVAKKRQRCHLHQGHARGESRSFWKDLELQEGWRGTWRHGEKQNATLWREQQAAMSWTAEARMRF